MPSNTDQGDELDAILTDVAETICGEWCSGEHTGVDAVNKHMKDEKAKLAEMLLAARKEFEDALIWNEQNSLGSDEAEASEDFRFMARERLNWLESQKTNGKQL